MDKYFAEDSVREFVGNVSNIDIESKGSYTKGWKEACKYISDNLKYIEPMDVISEYMYVDMLLERNKAVNQLNDLGLDLGEDSNKLIGKTQVLNYFYDSLSKYGDDIEKMMNEFTDRVIQGKPLSKEEIEIAKERMDKVENNDEYDG